MVTAYDAPGARIVDAAGVDMILVGDSVANVVLGYEDTLQVTVDDMAHHVAAVSRAEPGALVVGDLPWMSYHVDVADTVRNAATLIRAGAQCVKLEGGAIRAPMVRALVDAEIPVMGHIGLTPQSVNAFGGFRVQARDDEAAQPLIEGAAALVGAGAFAVVVEGVPEKVGAAVTEALDVPTIGIGAGAGLRRPGARAPRPARGDGADGQVRPALRHHWPTTPRRRSPPSPTTSARGPSRPTRRSTTERRLECSGCSGHHAVPQVVDVIVRPAPRRGARVPSTRSRGR